MKETKVQLPTSLTATNPKAAVKQATPATQPKPAATQQPATKRTSSAPAPKQQAQQAQSQQAWQPKPKGVMVAAENPNAAYNGSLAVYNAKSHSIKAVQEVTSPTLHFPATLHQSDLPPLPLREHTSVEDLLAELTTKCLHQPTTKYTERSLLKSNYAGPTPIKAPVVPSYASSYAAVAKHLPTTLQPGTGYDAGFEDSTIASYLALGTQALLERRAAAEERHRQRYRTRIAPKWEMDLRGTKHLTDMFAAYRDAWNVDLRATVFQRTVMRGSKARPHPTPEQEELSVTLCNTVLAERGFRPPKTARNEQYLLNSFLLFI